MAEKTQSLPHKKVNKQENGLVNLFVNILIPVLILNKLSQKIGPLAALLLALAFPLSYGLFDYFKNRKKNYFSLLGILNAAFTGSLALLEAEGIWFSIKEAFFPGLIGAFVFFSAFTKKPFIKSFFLNPQILNIDLIQEKIDASSNHDSFEALLKRSTLYLSTSFFISAILNFVISIKIFTPLSDDLDSTQKAILLNEQIAKMTSTGTAIILVPSMILMSLILWHLISGIKKATGLSTDEILKAQH